MASTGQVRIGMRGKNIPSNHTSFSAFSALRHPIVRRPATVTDVARSRPLAQHRQTQNLSLERDVKQDAEIRFVPGEPDGSAGAYDELASG